MLNAPSLHSVSQRSTHQLELSATLHKKLLDYTRHIPPFSSAAPYNTEEARSQTRHMLHSLRAPALMPWSIHVADLRMRLSALSGYRDVPASARAALARADEALREAEEALGV